ncbi:conjugative transposon protein TraM [Bacteroides oleiciplenus]|uniref:Conjugative transposon TraM protein n=1 Tax=Bacteroides oleiciplenus YIT 12058 TaxID=742727 RepID=K9DV15_9BACE|nr:conjugative transposon TraM protein [Bacteroides oleiciplenus YIT 12058]
MGQNRNPTSSPKEAKPKKPLTEQQRQRRKKMLVYPLMGVLFIGSMWLIFAPSSEDKEKDMQGQSFNTEMPSPDGGGIIGDKQKAYEQARLEEKRTERNHEMQSLASLFNGNAEEETEADAGNYDLAQPGTDIGTGGNRPSAIKSSATAYHDINRTLGNFYEQPKEDSEKEELRRRVEELEAQAAAGKDAAPGIDDQMALLERSYQLAAQYMPAGGKKPTEEDGSRARAEKKRNGNLVNGKATVEAVSQVEHEVVTALAQPMSNAEFVAACSGERNYDFHTAVGTASTVEKNTISACVHGNQTIIDGQTVRLRLLEAMEVADMVIPRNAVVAGAARIQGERLGIEITSLEYGGTIVPVELSVFDSDGQEGIFIPNSMEVSAAKEVAANMGSSLGSSINISTDAGAQLASDLGKGVIQGASQYIAKKMRTVKVHLKAGYKVMLYQPEN